MYRLLVCIYVYCSIMYRLLVCIYVYCSIMYRLLVCIYEYCSIIVASEASSSSEIDACIKPRQKSEVYL